MPSLVTRASFAELPPKAEAQRRRLARDWADECCSTPDCIGIKAAAIDHGELGESKCLTCMGSTGADLALRIVDAGGTLDLRGCKVSESWYETLQSARSDRPALSAIPGLIATAAEFGDEVFISADILGDAVFLGASFGAGTTFYDMTFKGAATFRHAFFASISFRKSVFAAEADFVEASFEDRANFEETMFQKGADFSETWFGPDTSFFGASFGDVADFRGASFEATDLGELSFAGPAQFERVRAEGSFRMAWSPGQETEPVVRLANARFSSPTGLKGSGSISLEGVDFRELSTISSSGEQLKVTSLDGTNCERLTLQDCDLSDCLLRGAVRLGKLDLEGETMFARTSGWQTRRRWLADERRFASSSVSPVGDAPGDSREVIPTTGATEVPEKLARSERHWIESRYKVLRKGLEDSGSYPAASDFYYGQMLQRLKLATGVERFVLELYRAVGGFGVRAWRPFTSLVVVIIAGAVIFDLWGQTGANFGDGLETSLQSAISLTRPIDEREVLQGIGFTTALALRIAGPVMVAFGVVALRARVRR